MEADNNKGLIKIVGSSIVALVALGFLASYVLLPFFTRDVYTLPEAESSVLDNNEVADQEPMPEEPSITHVATPESVKGIYITACAAGTPSFRDRLVNLVKTTELNTVVIDVKDFSGTLSFTPENTALQPFIATNCPVHDMKEFISSLHESDIYVIARITVFQDPAFAKSRPDLAVKKASDKTTWKDKKGLSFTDPGSKEVWDHILAISNASYDIGFDELNFDYIRFPSDGNMRDIFFTWSDGRPKPVVLEEFFQYLHQKLKVERGIPISADLFGMTTTNTDDLNIGQVLESAMPYFDFIYPMVYPSHYPPTFNGWANPNAHPYELIKYTMGRAVERTIATTTTVKTLYTEPIASTSPQLYSKPSFDMQKMRPWIQDFSLGQPRYGVNEVKAQIQATYDIGLTSWLLWNAGNNYTKEALLSE